MEEAVWFHGSEALLAKLNGLALILAFPLVGCYAKNFGPKGFGYGQGAGALVHAR